MKKYWVYITLCEEYEAEDEDDAFDQAMEDIQNRDGMEIMKHEVIERGE